MAKYNVAFESGGSVHEVGAKSIKVGNMFLVCFGRVNGDDQVVAQIPFDAIQYVTHESVTVSTEDVQN